MTAPAAPPAPDRRSNASILLPAIAAAAGTLAATRAQAQINYVSRNGQHLAACGPATGGPAQSANFSVPVSTPSTTLTVNHPGPAPTSASITFEAASAPANFSLSASGMASRGSTIASVGAVADCRESWSFSIAAPACFTLSISLDHAVSTPGDATASVLFAGPAITLDPGSSPPPLGHNITTGNGQFSGAWSGTLGPGTYLAFLNQRVGAVGFPFTGTFDGHLTLAIVPCTPPCDPDLNQDGNVDQDDLDFLISVVAGGPNPNNVDPDFNRDGNIDQDDINALVNVISGGACP